MNPVEYEQLDRGMRLQLNKNSSAEVEQYLDGRPTDAPTRPFEPVVEVRSPRVYGSYQTAFYGLAILVLIGAATAIRT
jgi:hypothetical protein